MLGDFVLFVAVGFAAQLVDGAIGMAYGLSGTTVITACRMIENVGTANKPASPARMNKTQYPANGATDQQTASTTTDGSTTRRSPNRSSRRPRQGLLTAVQPVTTAVTSPAWA